MEVPFILSYINLHLMRKAMLLILAFENIKYTSPLY